MSFNRPPFSKMGGILFCSAAIMALSGAVGQDSSESTAVSGVSAPSSFSQKMLHGLTSAMNERVAQNSVAQNSEAAAIEPPKEDPDFDRIRQSFLDEILLQKGTSWFTQYLDSGHPIPVELKNFQIEGPHPVSITDSEKRIGIKKKVSFKFRSTSFRQFAKSAGWGEWKSGVPASFTGFAMMQKDGIWQITDSPAKSYSLLRNR